MAERGLKVLPAELHSQSHTSSAASLPRVSPPALALATDMESIAAPDAKVHLCTPLPRKELSLLGF